MNKKVKKFPAWTYKKAMRHIPSLIPKGSFETTKEYVRAFDQLNHLIEV